MNSIVANSSKRKKCDDATDAFPDGNRQRMPLSECGPVPTLLPIVWLWNNLQIHFLRNHCCGIADAVRKKPSSPDPIRSVLLSLWFFCTVPFDVPVQWSIVPNKLKSTFYNFNFFASASGNERISGLSYPIMFLLWDIVKRSFHARFSSRVLASCKFLILWNAPCINVSIIYLNLSRILDRKVNAPWERRKVFSKCLAPQLPTRKKK